uniref:Beta-ketoadipate enol-lactone hydrolase n=2 Tax=Nonomuraea gerenzanensis TaxID=93944 RepID=A0A1M4DWM0_9ACTN|nr:Beta-ketoadipate enol-lactone hydrolase [Nonomuraea gerenzanensis]
MWDPQWQPLADAGFQVIRCDLRGFGQSPLPAQPYSNSGDLLDLLDSLGLDQVTLIGSSYGGKVAVETAAAHPDRVAALILLAAALPGREPTPERRALGDREDALVEAGDLAAAAQLMVETSLGPDAGEDAKRLVREMQLRAYELQLAEGVAGPVKPEVDPAGITMPCLAVSGAHDLPDFRDTATFLPAARHVELPWAGHLPSMERPAEVTDLIVSFLRETSGTSPSA